MQSIKVQCPAKINLTLKVVNKRPDGYHNIDSIMQTIDLYDYLSISVEKSENFEIILSGNNPEIPYDSRNLVYKAAELFFSNTKLPTQKVCIDIEKNIPIAAGLAGGSTDAAGTLYGLNKIYNEVYSTSELHELCAKLGSDLNVCLAGGCLKTSGRGEIIVPVGYKSYDVRLIKPIGLGISAKEAYTKFSSKMEKNVDVKSRDFYANDLEWAIIDDYEKLKYIKQKYKSSMMTGSGSTYFSLEEDFYPEEGYWVNNNLKTIDKGVSVCEQKVDMPSVLSV